MGYSLVLLGPAGQETEVDHAPSVTGDFYLLVMFRAGVGITLMVWNRLDRLAFKRKLMGTMSMIR